MIRESEFKAPWWLSNAHLQTIYSSVFRKVPVCQIRSEKIELHDGDFIELNWLDEGDFDAQSPIFLLLHGLEGSVDSHYIRSMMHTAKERGWRAVTMHFRSCGKELNRLPRSYHSGDTGDLGEILKVIRAEHPDVHLLATGYSLGGNVLLKYLGEQGDNSLIDYAAAVSVPFLLAPSSQRLDRGFSKAYRNRLLSELKEKVKRKFANDKALEINMDDVDSINTFFQFDQLFTAPLHGFKDAIDYYHKASSRQFLKSIRKPTLILHSADDPFMTHEVIPTSEELADCVTLELSQQGGHVGFLTGKYPWDTKFYVDDRIPSWFDKRLKYEAE